MIACCFRLNESKATGLEVDGCEVSLAEAEAALGVVPRGFLFAVQSVRGAKTTGPLAPKFLASARPAEFLAARLL
jgi:hypothetical protein